MVEENKLVDLHFRMEPQNFIPVGASKPLTVELDDGTIVPMDAAWIQSQRDSVLAYEAPVILDGEWEFRAVDKLFENYIELHHRVPGLLGGPLFPRTPVEFCLGLDFGEERLRTAAVLVAVDRSGPYPRVFVVDEYVPETATTEDMDAVAIVAMLTRNGLKWSDLDHVFGDKRYTDRSGYITKKSCKTMQGEVEKVLGVRDGTLRPRIRRAKRGRAAGRGAPGRGYRWLNNAMIRPDHFYIDRDRCPWGNECLNKFDGTDKSQHKDWVDGLRYGLKEYILGRGRRRSRASLNFG